MRFILFFSFIFSQFCLADIPADIAARSQFATSTLIQDLQWERSFPTVLTQQEVQRTAQREIHHVTLEHSIGEKIQLYISGPLGFTTRAQAYPALFVSAGFTTGSQTLDLLSDVGDMVVVAYQYPTSTEAILKDPSLLPKGIRLAPAQIALALGWLRTQSWLHPQKLTAVGISLGSLFLPVSLHLAEKKNIKVNATVFGFGGANIPTTLKEIFEKEFPNMRMDFLVEAILKGIFYLHDPRLHLPFIQAPFLVLGATQDQLFSRANTEEQFQVLNGYKELIWIQGPHIDVGQDRVIHETIRAISEFLARQGF